ncbi:MAG: DUF2256 domain-containing protein [Planctomycetia bacterium]|nr:DUF2256 domain-containing protein [Planctomycetia bacterium]
MTRKPIERKHLPTKLCAACGRPFSWRRKWARCWEQVRYCSERCRRHSAPMKASSPIGRPN